MVGDRIAKTIRGSGKQVPEFAQHPYTLAHGNLSPRLLRQTSARSLVIKRRAIVSEAIGIRANRLGQLFCHGE